eukprot:Gb_33625 [translate_table: standard]
MDEDPLKSTGAYEASPPEFIEGATKHSTGIHFPGTFVCKHLINNPGAICPKVVFYGVLFSAFFTPSGSDLKQANQCPLPYRCMFFLAPVQYQQFEEAGTDLGQLLSQKKSIEAKKAGMPMNIAKAIARISGGLYVVTAVKGSSKGAMVASWVSQASFKPLGITIAVAKDRAIESLMQVEDTFVLNCLEEGKYAPLMKHFLKRFPPGANRFEGVQWAPASNGSPILIDSLAYLECKVVSRMETSDHWIVYSHVTDGNVSKPEGRTASHHRKIGNYY